ncbi:MAG: hypothetical protein OEO23_14760, partial [Gemmatimonadota bacterium]|nr:hypothetical protein [Gemmatimonadota bacterium]
MSDFPSPRLTTGQAARLLGVHASTVKRWFDDVPEDEMTPGSHRRLALDQVISEGRLRGYGTYLDAFGPDAGLVWQASAAWDQGNYASLHRLCYQWAKAGRADKIGKVLLHVGGGGRLDAEVLDGAFGGCLHMVGEAWEEGRFSVGEERAVSWEVVETLLQLIRENPPAGPEASTPVAVVGAMEGDHHFLGSLLVRALLTVKDWRVEFLGGDVPVEEFVATRNDHSA